MVFAIPRQTWRPRGDAWTNQAFLSPGLRTRTALPGAPRPITAIKRTRSVDVSLASKSVR
jgi:hypothetical protein